MPETAAPISSVAELEEHLSRPTPALVQELGRLKGALVILGVGGKMGPTLARMARRALDEAGSKRAVVGVARFTNPTAREGLQATGVRTVACDLLDRNSVSKLPDAAAAIFMAGMKFGSTGSEATTWAMNTYLPALVSERYPGIPTVVFSTGNVYPFMPVESGGASEDVPPGPIGEYAQSCLGRERTFEFFSRKLGTPAAIFRLNYAVELRYGVLLEIAERVWNGRPVDVRMGYVNVIWQGDANAMALRCLAAAASPPEIFNVTGIETLAVRRLAERFGELLGKRPVIEGTEEPNALLSNVSKAHARLGGRAVELDTILSWVAHWVKSAGVTLGKPTHFETRDGKF